jgi:DNA anti-recombination protein RmuC
MEVMTAMEASPTRWNDDRLDEFARNVDKRFDQVDKRFDKVDERFEKVDERFDKVDQRFERLESRMETGFNRINDRFDDLMKVLIYGFFGLIGVLVAGMISILATQI